MNMSEKITWEGPRLFWDGGDWRRDGQGIEHIWLDHIAQFPFSLGWGATRCIGQDIINETPLVTPEQQNLSDRD